MTSAPRQELASGSGPIMSLRLGDKPSRKRYKRCNEVSEFDGYPMPRVDELLDRLGRTRYISTLDLTKGYWQVPLTEKAKPKTAFSIPSGHWQYGVLPSPSRTRTRHGGQPLESTSTDLLGSTEHKPTTQRQVCTPEKP